jgi:hypothetical protein
VRAAYILGPVAKLSYTSFIIRSSADKNVSRVQAATERLQEKR